MIHTRLTRCAAGLLMLVRCCAPVVAAVMLLVMPIATFGQGRQSADATLGDIRIGLGSVIVGEAWSPIDVDIIGGDQAQQCVLSISFVQDGSQRVSVRRDVAATPGRTTTERFIAALPGNVNLDLRVMLKTPRGEQTVRFDNSGMSEEGFSAFRELPKRIPSDALLVGVVNTRALGPGGSAPLGLDKMIPVVNERQRSGQQNSDYAVGDDGARLIELVGRSLPSASAAYQPLDMLVLRAEAFMQIEPRQRAAIKQWVQHGGSLVIVASQPGPDWARWLAGMVPPDVLVIEDVVPESTATPPAILSAIDGLKIADRLTYRPVRVRERSKRDAWRPILPIIGSGDAAMGATGPVGFGFITLLGVEPARLPAVVNDEGIAKAWSALLSVPLKRETDRLPMGADVVEGGARERDTNNAVEYAINALTDVPALPIWLGWVICGSVVLLAVILGPLDMLLLGRLKLRHRSFISALLWILLATIIAWRLPGAVRPGGTRANQVQVVDVLQGAQPDRAFAAQSGIIAVFAAASDVGNLQGFTPGTLVRGVAASSSSRMSSLSLPEMILTQSMSAIATPAASEGEVPDPNEAANVTPEQLALTNWTLRCFNEQGPTASPVVVIPDAAGGAARFTLRLPVGAQVKGSALLHTRDGWMQLRAERLDERSIALAKAGEFMFDRPVEAWALPVVTGGYLDYGGGSYASASRGRVYVGGIERPSWLLNIPGAATRASSCHARVQSGHWGVLYVHVTGLPPTLRLGSQHPVNREAVLRVQFPLPQAWRSGG